MNLIMPNYFLRFDFTKNILGVKSVFFIFCLFFLCCAEMSVFSKTMGKDIALFKLGGEQNDLPPKIFEQIDNAILQTFQKFPGFHVIPMHQKFSTINPETFNSEILKIKEEKSSPLDEIRMDGQTFKKRDWEDLIKSYMAVVPFIAECKLLSEQTEDKAASFTVVLKIQFYLIAVQKNKTIASFQITTEGSGSSSETAFFDAVEIIPFYLENMVRARLDLRSKTVAAKIDGRTAVLETSTNLNIKQGDEYAVIERELKNGSLRSKETGLLLIKEVREENSLAEILYASPSLAEGSELKAISRLPIVFKPFFELAIPIPYKKEKGADYSIGLQIIHSRGFYRVRPMYGVAFIFPKRSKDEIPEKTDNGETGVIVPIQFFAGAELYNSYFGRTKITPQAAAFITFNQQGKGFRHIRTGELGLKLDVDTSWLVSRDMLFGFSVGGRGAYRFGNEKPFSFSITFQLGLTFKI